MRTILFPSMHIAQVNLQGTFALNYILSSRFCAEIGLPFPVVYLRKHKLTKLRKRIHLLFIWQILWQEWEVQDQININSPSHHHSLNSATEFRRNLLCIGLCGLEVAEYELYPEEWLVRNWEGGWQIKSDERRESKQLNHLNVCSRDRGRLGSSGCPSILQDWCVDSSLKTMYKTVICTRGHSKCSIWAMMLYSRCMSIPITGKE